MPSNLNPFSPHTYTDKIETLGDKSSNTFKTFAFHKYMLSTQVIFNHTFEQKDFSY